MKLDIIRLIVHGALSLLLHDNADIIDILNEHNRPDLVNTINTFESAFTWLKKQLESSEKESA